MDFSHRLCARGALCAFSLCAMPQLSAETADSPATTDWQLQRLMQPTPAQLGAEERGRITIYDSLTMNQVDAAMDTHFDRIDNMMFIRIHHLPPTGAGTAEVEDDGCD